jgi:hypothetical protein
MDFFGLREELLTAKGAKWAAKNAKRGNSDPRTFPGAGLI